MPGQQQRAQSVGAPVEFDESVSAEVDAPVSNEVMLEQIREVDPDLATEAEGKQEGILQDIWNGLFGKKGTGGSDKGTGGTGGTGTEAPTEEEAPPETEEKGGVSYVCKGDAYTLRNLAKHAYGHEFYWTHLRDHNITERNLVNSGGTLLFPRLGTIAAPKLQVPKTGSPGVAPAGGEDKPFKLKREVLPQGSLAIWPDGWANPFLPNCGMPGDIHVKQSKVAEKKATLEQGGRADRDKLVTDTKDAGEGTDHITETTAGATLEELSKLPVTEINAAIRGMGNDKWAKIKELAPDTWKNGEGHARFVAGQRKKIDGNAPSESELKDFFDVMSNTDVYALQELVELRFKFKVGGRDGGGWTADGLRRAWEVLEKLPPDHVQNNLSLDMLLRDNADAGGGYYRGSDKSGVIGYDEKDLSATGSYGQVMVDGKDEGLHSAVNLFDCVLRHEIGHAVDAKLGVETYAKATETAGKWKTYNTHTEFVDDVIATHPDGMSKYAKPTEYEKALRKAIKETKNFDTALAELKSSGDIASDTPDYDGSQNGPVDILRTVELWAHGKSPWYKQPQRAGVGGRRFQQAYSWQYSSYTAQTFDDRAISAYQFRAPGEWFAEAYACFYSDHPSVNGKEPGTALRTRDNATAEYIKNNVDKGHSFADEVPESTETDTPSSDGKSAVSGPST